MEGCVYACHPGKASGFTLLTGPRKALENHREPIRSRKFSMRKLRHPDRLGLHLRLVLANGVVIGPGRAELLEAIREHGSISAAGRAIGMSYKRAWDLTEAVNGAFRPPLVETSTGGPVGGGTRLTPAGEAVVAAYRRIEAQAAAATTDEIRSLTALLAPELH